MGWAAEDADGCRAHLEARLLPTVEPQGGQMVDANKAARRAAQDPAWRARYERSLARCEAKLTEDNAIEEGWHDFAYVEDGPTPDWVRSLGDEDPDPDSMVA